MEYPKIFAPNEGQTLTIQQNSPRKSKPFMKPPKVPELPASSSNTSPKNLAKVANLPSSIEIKTLIDPKDWWDRPNKHSTVIYHWRSMTINGDLIATTISGQPSVQKIKCKDWIKVNFFRKFLLPSLYHSTVSKESNGKVLENSKFLLLKIACKNFRSDGRTYDDSNFRKIFRVLISIRPLNKIHFRQNC